MNVGMSALSVVGCAICQEAAPAASAKDYALTGGGVAFMVLSLLFVWGLAIWCFKRVLTTPAPSDPGPAGKP